MKNEDGTKMKKSYATRGGGGEGGGRRED